MFFKWPNVLSHFSQNVWKYTIMNTVMASLQLWDDKWPKCFSEKKTGQNVAKSLPAMARMFERNVHQITSIRCHLQEDKFILDTILHWYAMKVMLTGSTRNGRTASTTCCRISSMNLWQPSPTAEMAIRPACLYRQSAGQEQNTAPLSVQAVWTELGKREIGPLRPQLNSLRNFKNLNLAQFWKRFVQTKNK